LREQPPKPFVVFSTADITEQWRKFILEPLAELEGPLSQNVVVVIDALDESGAEATREKILGILAAYNERFAANIRIVLTSWPIKDIGQKLLESNHVQARSLDDVEVESVTRDIAHYISTTLKKLCATFSDRDVEQLAVKSNDLFKWGHI